MRRRFVCANWKMNLLAEDATRYAQAMSAAAGFVAGPEVAIFPPSTLLMLLARMLSGSGVAVGAQDCHFEAKGAFTGAVSAAHVRDAGARHVLVGHSERRTLFGDDDRIVRAKLDAALAEGLHPVLCVGESEAEREAGQTEAVLEWQAGAMADLTDAEIDRLAIAYEPVWAIGTGRVATPLQAQEAHAFIRSCVGTLLGEEAARSIRILYGGSVTRASFPGLLEQQDVDGALVGGASLDPDKFLELIRQAS
jgi:triosephosphate isomerase